LGVETETLPSAEKEALLSLLDDPSPTVRRALLARFLVHGAAAANLLQEIAHSSNRVLARHAAWFIEELKLTDPVSEFRTFIRSLNYELETGRCSSRAPSRPQLDVAECRAEIDEMAARCRELISEPSSNREKCRVINRVLFHEWGFRGNVEQYTDPMNSFIDKVLTRRKGIPISLSVLYLLVGERLGLPWSRSAFPGTSWWAATPTRRRSSSTLRPGTLPGRGRGLRPPALQPHRAQALGPCPHHGPRGALPQLPQPRKPLLGGERPGPRADLLGIR
jgi:hypothetical protein